MIDLMKKYDVIIYSESFFDKWEVRKSDKLTKNVAMLKEFLCTPRPIVAVYGNFDKGKTWLMSRLF